MKLVRSEEASVVRVPPTICLTEPEWRSMQGRNLVILLGGKGGCGGMREKKEVIRAVKEVISEDGMQLGKERRGGLEGHGRLLFAVRAKSRGHRLDEFEEVACVVPTSKTKCSR